MKIIKLSKSKEMYCIQLGKETRWMNVQDVVDKFPEILNGIPDEMKVDYQNMHTIKKPSFVIDSDFGSDIETPQSPNRLDHSSSFNQPLAQVEPVPKSNQIIDIIHINKPGKVVILLNEEDEICVVDYDEFKSMEPQTVYKYLEFKHFGGK